MMSCAISNAAQTQPAPPLTSTAIQRPPQQGTQAAVNTDTVNLSEAGMAALQVSGTSAT